MLCPSSPAGSVRITWAGEFPVLTLGYFDDYDMLHT